MPELKTGKNNGSVNKFLESVENIQRKKDALKVLNLMKKVTGEEPKMWGSSIIGFGQYHYKYDSGREGDWFKTGVSPRKQNLSIYIMAGFDKYSQLLTKLGKFKTGKSCLYINKLEDVDIKILEKLILESLKYMTKKYG